MAEFKSDDLDHEYQAQKSDLALLGSLEEDPGRNFLQKHLVSSVIQWLCPYEGQRRRIWLRPTTQSSIHLMQPNTHLTNF